MTESAVGPLRPWVRRVVAQIAAPPLRSSARDDAAAPAWALYATIALALASILIAIVAALTRGPWIDEFWTLFAIEPDLSLNEAFHQRWLTDVIPPLFYFLSRQASWLLGDDLTVLRLQNLPAMVALLAFFLHAAASWKKAWRFLLPYAVLSVSSYFATGYFAEYRSYYIQFVCAVCFYGCAYALLHGEHLSTTAARRVALLICAITCVLLVNLHFLTALLTAISLAGMAGIAVLRRQPLLAAQLCAIGLAAAVPLATILWMQAPLLARKAGGHFWIDTSAFSAIVVLAGALVKSLGANLVVFALALGGLRRHPDGRADADLTIGVGFVAIAIFSIGVLLVANQFTPIIIDRYLLLACVGLMCGVSILAGRPAFSWRFGFPLMLANAAAFLVISDYKLIAEPRWNASAALIAAQVGACPDATVVGLAFPYPGALSDEGAVFALGYRYLADRYGFHVTAARPGGLHPGGVCPTILWLEHVNWKLPQPSGPDLLVLDTVRQVVGPIDLAGTVVQRTKTGAVITLAPAGKAYDEHG